MVKQLAVLYLSRIIYCRPGNIREVFIFANFVLEKFARTNSRIQESRENYYYNRPTNDKWKFPKSEIRENWNRLFMHSLYGKLYPLRWLVLQRERQRKRQRKNYQIYNFIIYKHTNAKADANGFSCESPEFRIEFVVV